MASNLPSFFVLKDKKGKKFYSYGGSKPSPDEEEAFFNFMKDLCEVKKRR